MLCLVCEPTGGGEQGLAPLVHRPHQRVRRLGPFLEQPAGGTTVADAQLELEEMEAEERVAVRLAALVRDPEEALEDGTCLLHFSAPREPSPGCSFGREQDPQVDGR